MLWDVVVEVGWLFFGLVFVEFVFMVVMVISYD